MNPVEPSTTTLAGRIQRFVPARVATPAGEVEFRRAGTAPAGVTHVLLHGIGSGSGSWLMQLEAAARSEGVGVLAWEAPGYGASSPVGAAHPDAGDYASRLWAWLDALDVSQPVTLVGHSLGALMATRAALQRPRQVARLVLLSPAQGYARASEEDRAKKLNDRLANLQALGPAGMAQKRGAAMLSPRADAAHVAYVQSIMAQVHVGGYTQASHLLAGGDLLADLAKVTCPVAVASGQADTITLPAGCQAVAAAAGVPWTDLGDAGHACALDAFGKVNALLGLPDSGKQQKAAV
ncbi:MAG: alpha/beta hydrolase [Pseudomonadota bacterium]